MKSKIKGLAIAMLFLAMPAFAQTVRMHGVVKDQKGQPVEGAVLEMKNSDNGAHVTLKTNKKGEFLNVGVQFGPYNYTLKTKDGVEMTHGKITIPAQDEFVQDFDLSKGGGEPEHGAAAPAASAEKPAAQQPAKPAAPAQLTEEQKKKMAEIEKENAAIQAENATIGQVNAKLTAARAAASGGNIQQGIDLLKPVAQAGSKYDIVYGQLADLELRAVKTADATTRPALLQDAGANLAKALELLNANAAAQKDPAKVSLKMGVYYTALSEVQARTGQFDLAMQSADKAAGFNKTGASTAYFNVGALALNANKSQMAANAFDKSIEANPQNADAYYQKGISLLGLAKVEGGKTVAPPGTEEALSKYLELQPQGKYAEAAQQMLETIGAKVATTYKKK